MSSILLFFYLICAYGQTYNYKHYGIGEGLPSSEVYCVFQDSKGYMWFGTDGGVSRFNGYEFENFNSSDGLTDDTVFLITEDGKGRIWFGTFNCQLSYYAEGRIHEYKHNDVLREQLQGRQTLASFYVDTLDAVWLGFSRSGLKKIDTKGNLEDFSKPLEQKAGLLIYRHESKLIFGASPLKLAFENPLVKSVFHYTNKDRMENYHQMFYVDFFYRSHHPKVVEVEGDLLIYNKLGFYFFDREDRQFEGLVTPQELKELSIIGLYYEEKFLYVCTIQEGIFKCIVESGKIIIKDKLLDNLPVSGMYKDREDGYWFSTLDDGIYYCPSFLIMKSEATPSLKDEDHISDIICDGNGNLMFAFEKKGVFFQQQVSKEIKLLLPPDGDTNRSFYYDAQSKQISVCHYKNILSYKEDALIEKRAIGYKDVYINSHLRDADIFYISLDRALLAIDGNGFSIKNSFNYFVTSLIKYKDLLWVGTNKGIFIYQDEKITIPFPNDTFLSSAITSMERLGDELLIIGTKAYGLLIVKGNNMIDRIDKTNGLAGNLVRKVHIDNQNTIWAATNMGLSRIQYKGVEDYELYNLTKKHGLSANEIIDLDSYDNTIYVLTSKDLLEFDRRKIRINTTPPSIRMTLFEVNGKTKKVENHYRLNHEENNIRIGFEGLTYRGLQDQTYQYRIQEIDTAWISTLNRSVHYSILYPGSYHFEVKVENEDGFYSRPAIVSWVISAPFWRTTWFVVTCILLGLMCIYTFFRFRIHQNNAKKRTEKAIMELELKALRSQMNPHFIFNTLNSIQHFIGKNDFKSTNRYITMFSKLIRSILHLSEQETITVQQEIETLSLYLNLEKMRFDQEFDYTIELDEKVEPHYHKIPSMLIQPYVENAIWHGLMNSNEIGKIEIKITVQNIFLNVEVSDNGIGRDRALGLKEKNKNSQKSVGMSVTRERLNLLNNNSYEVEIPVEITNIYGSNKEMKKVKGTKVSIKIPLLN